MVRWLVLVLVLVGVAFPSVQARAQAGGGDEPNPLETVQGKWTQGSGATSCRTSSELRVVGTELVETSAGGRASRKTISRAEGYEISLEGGRETILLTPNDENRIERVTASNSRQVQFRCSSSGVLVHRDGIGDRPSDPIPAQGAARNTAAVLAESGDAVVIGDGGRWCGPVASLLLDAGRDISERGDAALISNLMRELSVTLPRRCPQAAKATVRIATPDTMEWSFTALKLSNGNWSAKDGSWQRSQNAVYTANRADEQLRNLRESEPVVRPAPAPATPPTRTATAQAPAGAQPPQRTSPAKPPVVSQQELQTVVALRDLAEKGDAEAQFYLGNRYDTGRGVAKDDAQAMAWFRKAAEQGDAYAQFNLGVMYANGLGVAKDEAQAVAWFRKAAVQGHAESQYNLGVQYARGEGVAKDDAQAVAWFRKAAQQGYAEAQFTFGVMYDNGLGVAKDGAQAVASYRKAAEQGYAEAQFKLAVMYAKGKGVAEDDAQVLAWLSKAAAQGHADAQYVLKTMNLNGHHNVNNCSNLKYKDDVRYIVCLNAMADENFKCVNGPKSDAKDIIVLACMKQLGNNVKEREAALDRLSKKS